MDVLELSQFTVAIIAEFAQRYHLTDRQAAQYLLRYHAIEMCEKHYGIMHTQSFESNVDDLSIADMRDLSEHTGGRRKKEN